MIYGYARVSSTGQARDGNSLEAQDEALHRAGVDKIFLEQYTGTKRHRPKFDRLMDILKEGDTLVVTKLDRFARSTIDGCNLMKILFDKGVTVNVLNLGVMDNTPNGKLIRTIFFAVAEWERDMIVERTNEGKYYARQREDYREGRCPKEILDFEKFYQKQKDGEITVKEACERLCISRTTWYKRVAELIA